MCLWISSPFWNHIPGTTKSELCSTSLKAYCSYNFFFQIQPPNCFNYKYHKSIPNYVFILLLLSKSAFLIYKFIINLWILNVIIFDLMSMCIQNTSLYSTHWSSLQLMSLNIFSYHSFYNCLGLSFCIPSW